MKILSRGGWITDLQIILGAELQKPFEARTGMLWSLPFVAMRQEQRETRRLPPLVFRGSDVLIDDGLCAVYKISKLGFPQHQCLARNDRIAILETQHAFLRKGAVEDFKPRFGFRLGPQLTKRCPGLTGLRVIQHGMPLTNSAATGVLTTQAHATAFDDQ